MTRKAVLLIYLAHNSHKKHVFYDKKVNLKTLFEGSKSVGALDEHAIG